MSFPRRIVAVLLVGTALLVGVSLLGRRAETGALEVRPQAPPSAPASGEPTQRAAEDDRAPVAVEDEKPEPDASSMWLTGAVRTESGDPARGARVTFLRAGDAESAAADDQGRFRLKATEHRELPHFVRVEAPDCAQRVLELYALMPGLARESTPEGQFFQLDIVLSHGAALDLALRWPDGAPCTEARVRGLGDARAADGPPRATDASGRVRLEGLEPGRVATVGVDLEGLPRWAVERYELRGGANSEVLVVPRPCALEVRLIGTGPAGAQLPPAKLVVEPRIRAGRERFRVPREHAFEDRQAIVNGGRLGERFSLGVWLEGYRLVTFESDWVVQKDREVLELDLALLEFVPLSPAPSALETWALPWRFVSPTGDPLDGAALLAAGIDPGAVQLRLVGADGSEQRSRLFGSIGDPAGPVQGQLRCGVVAPARVYGRLDGQLVVDAHVEPGSTLDWTVDVAARQCSRTRLTLRAVDASGAAIGLARAAFVQTDLEGPPHSIGDVDQDGSLLAWLEPGAYRALVTTVAGRELEVRVDVPAGEEHEQVVTVRAPCSLRGTLSGDVAGRFGMVEVLPRDSGIAIRPAARAPLGVGGGFAVDSLAPGAYVIRAWAVDLDGRQPKECVLVASSTVDLVPGSVAEVSLRTRSDPRGGFSLSIVGADGGYGRLVDAAGAPIFVGAFADGITFRPGAGVFELVLVPYRKGADTIGPDYTDRWQEIVRIGEDASLLPLRIEFD